MACLCGGALSEGEKWRLFIAFADFSVLCGEFSGCTATGHSVPARVDARKNLDLLRQNGAELQMEPAHHIIAVPTTVLY